mmetsp:Transcript_2364/g.4445  ORF Transcript_2364/g.4445 Transcript_2364/m.4445 type:complete len:261 (-) Transcript_2364:709-1491(-)
MLHRQRPIHAVQTGNRGLCSLQSFLRIRKVFDLTRCVFLPRRHVKMAMATHVEKHNPSLPMCFCGYSLLHGTCNGMCGLWCWKDSLCLKEAVARIKSGLLLYGCRFQLTQMLQVGDQRCHRMVPKPSGMHSWRHEGAAQCIDLHQRCHLTSVTKVIRIDTLGQRWARCRLHSHKTCLFWGLTAKLLTKEREGNSSEVGAATSATDNDVRIFTYKLHLIDGLEANDCLMHEHMAEHAPESILRLTILGCDTCLNSLRDCDS